MSGGLQLFTFRLDDGREVTHEGLTEAHARVNAGSYYVGRLSLTPGAPARECQCLVKRVWATRQAGFLICSKCAGFIG